MSTLQPCCPSALRSLPRQVPAVRPTRPNSDAGGGVAPDAGPAIGFFMTAASSASADASAAFRDPAFTSRAPTLMRRLACFVYEGVLLFGVLMVAGFAYSTITQQRHALVGTTGLQVVVFLVLGCYFAGFWARNGQTLAMQTWQIRLVMVDGKPVPWRRAVLRYLLSWLWFLPALLVVGLSGVKGAMPTFVSVLAGVLAYAALTRLRSDRQFWHDAVCGTRLTMVAPQTAAKTNAQQT
jgi:uncharacterized RDD family membrane protein YckC